MIDDLGVLAELGGAAAVEVVASALGDRAANAAKCPNCGAPVIGPYCAACGQEHKSHRRSVRALVVEFLEEIASFDNRILRTARALLCQPGELSLAFHEGRQRRYVPALRLYLFVSLIFFLTLSATGIAIIQFELVAKPEKLVINAKGETFAITQGNTEPEPIAAWKAKLPGPQYAINTETHFFQSLGSVHSNLPPAAREKLRLERLHVAQKLDKNSASAWITSHVFHTVDALQENPAAVNGTLTEWIPRVLFILLPIYALVMAAFYWRQRKKFYFVDHLVFSLNMHSFVFVAILFAVGLAQILPQTTVAWLALAAIGTYGLLAMQRFYRQNWFWTMTKFLTISLVYTTFFLMPAVAIAISVSFLGL